MTEAVIASGAVEGDVQRARRAADQQSEDREGDHAAAGRLFWCVEPRCGAGRPFLTIVGLDRRDEGHRSAPFRTDMLFDESSVSCPTAPTTLLMVHSRQPSMSASMSYPSTVLFTASNTTRLQATPLTFMAPLSIKATCFWSAGPDGSLDLGVLAA